LKPSSAVSAAVAAILFFASRPASAQVVFNQADKQTILDAHNDARCGVTPAATVMPPLVWDARLEATAQVWANACVDAAAPTGLIDHNPLRSNGHPFSVGENIYAAYPGPASPLQAVVLWVNERVDYNLADNTCTLGKACGHYTQVVWANTRRVGCARSYCPALAAEGWPSSIVCDYGPAGNVIGQRPYVAGSGVNGACDLVFADGFELGDLAPWSSAQTDAGDLAISASAGMASTLRGLQAVVDDTASLFVSDATPQDANRYRARFRFDPDGFDPGEAEEHRRTRIFIAFEEDPNRRLAAVVLRRLSGAYSIMARTRLDDDSQADTAFVPITDAPHVIEIDWKRSSSPAASDGWLYLWIDGNAAGSNPVAALTGLDNNLSAVDFARLGALSVKSGASGTLYFDEFESRNQSYIGP
jgi:uncharacterized protein YkwD